MKKLMPILLSLSLLLVTGCGSRSVAELPKTNPEQIELTIPELTEDMFTDRDRNTQYCQEDCILIQLNGAAAMASSNSVSVDGNTMILTADATYLLSGSLENGSIVVDAGENAKPRLVLQGVTINSASAALEIREADKVFVTLAEGTENLLSSGCTEGTVDGAVFSNQDLTFNGSGSLTVSSASAHGIVCKDDLVFTGGRYQIQSASHGLDANDSVRITGNTALTVVSGKDGIHCENKDDADKGFVYIEDGNLKINAQGDGISSGANACILDGNLEIVAGGGSVNGSKEHSDFFGGFMGGAGSVRPREMESAATEDGSSMKGLKAAGDIYIGGGLFNMDTADDCIHSNTAIAVAGGSFELRSGDDAFHADEALTVHAGQINIKTSYESLEAHKIDIRGGEFELHAKDDGINAAGGQDSSGTEGGRDGMFAERPMKGGRPGGPMYGGRPGGPMGGGSSDGVIDISGGRLKIYSSGDGMDANGSITISGGEIYVTNPSSGDTSVLDSDNGAKITGGSFIGAAASTMMAQSFTENSTQGVIACTVGRQSTGTRVSVEDAQGNPVVAFEMEYDSVLVIISTPELIKGETYTLIVGNDSGAIQAA